MAPQRGGAVSDEPLPRTGQLRAASSSPSSGYEHECHVRRSVFESRRTLFPFLTYYNVLITPQPINFLSLLHPSSTPPYHVFVARIIKSSDQQASIFLQQKLKVADVEERGKIIEAICNRGFEMMSHR
jgi:hypothetical protein